MKTLLKWTLTALLLSFGSTGWGQAPNVYNRFSPVTGVLKGSATSYFTQASVSADIRALWTGTCDATTFLRGDGACAVGASPAGSNSQIQFNNSGAFGATSLLTWNNISEVLNIGATTTPGTFSVGSLDSMVVNGTTIPIPGFALNSNIQGVFENHSYVNGTAAGGARYYGARSEGSITSPTIVANGDHLSAFYAVGYNGTNYSLGGSIIFSVDGTPGASAMPTDVDIALSPAGSQTPGSILKLLNTGAYAVNGSQGSAGNLLVSAGTGAPAAWASAASQAIPKIVSTPISGNCVNWVTSTTIGDTGSPCGAGGGGGVSSVGLTAPAEFAVSGSPVTTSGTLAVTRITGSATITFATSPSNVNVTTEGTLDWLLVGTGSVPDQSTNFANAGGARKLAGGLQIFGFGPAGATAFSTGGAWGTPSWTGSAGDSRTSTTSFTTYTQTLSFIPGANNVGEIFRVPCDPFQRVARIYVSNATAYHVVLASSDGSLNTDSGSHTPSTNEQITVTYKCTFPGQTVSIAVTDTASTSGNISIGGITLNTV